MAADRVRTRLVRLRAGFGSVRVRTTLVTTMAVALALLVASFLLVSLLVAQLTDTVRDSAQIQADELARVLAESEPASVSLTDDDDRLVQILDGTGTVIRTSSATVGRAPLSDVVPGDSAVISVAFDDDDYLAVATGVDRGPSYVVVVAHALDGVTESAATLRALLALGVPVLVLVLAAATWRVVGRALAPVEAIRSEVEEVSAAELHRRVPQPAAADEIGLLAATMNRMLARLEDARSRQQRFVADASHELRSPLASIRTHAEVAMSHPTRGSTADLAENVLAESLRMQHLVEDLIVLARADEQRTATQHVAVDLDDIVFAEVERLRDRSTVSLDTSRVSAGRVRGEPALLRRLVGNLLDNAVRHARSTVHITLAQTRDEVLLRIDDDGTGIPARERNRVFQRFSRLDDARTRDAGGAGLGLAIVAEVVAAHGGEIRLTDAPTGGARFEVRLPLSPTNSRPAGRGTAGSPPDFWSPGSSRG